MPLQAPAKIGNMKPEKKDKKKTGNGDMCSRTNSTMKCRAEGAEDNLARSSQVGRGGWPPFTGAEVFSETLGGGGGGGARAVRRMLCIILHLHDHALHLWPLRPPDEPLPNRTPGCRPNPCFSQSVPTVCTAVCTLERSTGLLWSVVKVAWQLSNLQFGQVKGVPPGPPPRTRTQWYVSVLCQVCPRVKQKSKASATTHLQQRAPPLVPPCVAGTASPPHSPLRPPAKGIRTPVFRAAAGCAAAAVLAPKTYFASQLTGTKCSDRILKTKTGPSAPSHHQCHSSLA